MTPDNTEPYGFSKRLTEEELSRMFASYNKMFGYGDGPPLEKAAKEISETYRDGKTETVVTKNGKTTRRMSFKGQWEDKNHRWHLGDYSECMDCGERLSEGHTLCCGHGFSGSIRVKGHECNK